ncbi:MAG: ABC transporter ATP-binding protein [Planctomycetales bacterium]|nr:ABC transporter ATP-binding protein [Planctomycetales bacterium]
MIEFAAATKTYPNGTLAVANATLRVAAGEFVTLLGPSGCGKSTLLRMAAGLTPPTTGRVAAPWLAETRSKEAQDDSATLGFVFQEPTLLPWANVWKNVYLPLRLAGVRRRDARERVDAVLAMVGLSEFSRAYPRELSGGMKMRASVARALVTRPQAMLLDEPFAALDEITRNRIDDDLLALWRGQRWAALFVTHSVFESIYLSTRVLVMSPRPGRIVEEIVVDLPQPRTPAVRSTARFAELCGQASAALARSMAA